MIKRLILFLFLLVTPFLVLALPIGDVNGDNKVTIADYNLIRKHVLGTKLTGDNLNRADINGDSKITVADYTSIRRIMMGTYTPVPTVKPTITPVPTTADGICESVKNNSSIDYFPFLTLSKKDKSSDKYKDDYKAIKAAHECANKYNKPVVITKGEYHIYKRNNSTIMIQTSVDFSNSKIFIHDENGIVKKTDYYIESVFKVSHDKCEDKKIKFDSLKYGSVVPELAGHENGMYVKVEDSSRTVFLRYGYNGANANDGKPARDAFRVDKNGKILDPLFWEYDKKKVKVTMCDISKETVTIKNGNFYTIVANVAATFSDKHFRRGIKVSRSNVIVDNINHRYVDSNLKGITKINYNYAGWFQINEASNVTYQNSKVQAMYNNYGNKKTYIYDISMYYATNIYVKNVNQYDYDGTKEYFSKSSNQLRNNLWGVMGSSGVKNITFDSCVLNRIDAHEFFYNLTIKNSKIGNWGITAGGFGKMLIENTDVYYTNHFVWLRGDYGSVWNGNIEIKNCGVHPDGDGTAHVIKYDLVKEGSGIHNYGYDLYLPSVTIDKFKVYNNSTTLKIFNSDGSTHYMTKVKINGGKYKFYYPSKKDIKVTNVTNKKGNKMSTSTNLYY